jgi:hypothetical protein
MRVNINPVYIGKVGIKARQGAHVHMLIQINGTSGAEIFSFKGKWQAISESVFHSYKACRGSNEKNRCQ